MPKRELQQLPRLPIDEVIDDVVSTLLDRRALVLIAPPGAGKTTRVPTSLLAALPASSGDIVVLEPRRLAARMAARRVAAERGERVGDSIGYEVRFDRKIGVQTRIRYITEGVLLRRLLSDPTLRGTAAVIIDEFHERHLSADMALAIVRQLQHTSRPDLSLAVMSATMDPHPIAEFLDHCPIIESQGRQYPVDVEYLSNSGSRRQRTPLSLDKQVAAAVRRAVMGHAGSEATAGDVLVFLPGAGEIRRAMDACTDFGARADCDLLPLHGDLPPAEQDRAVAKGRKRKVIFATNVAETSVTIEGVTCVIDSGLARVAHHSPWSGVPTLRLDPISQASAAQRAGRAGRTAPGQCLRLYSRHDHDGRRAFDTAEVVRTDLAETALQLYALGYRNLGEFAWFMPPPPAARDAADELLLRLGAIARSEDGSAAAITELGQRMLRLPLHPRQARLLIAAVDVGLVREGTILAALVGERPLRLSQRTRLGSHQSSGQYPHVAEESGSSDLLADLERFMAAARDGLRGAHAAHRMRQQGLDPGALLAVDRVRRQLERIVRKSTAQSNQHPNDRESDKSPETLLRDLSDEAPDGAIDEALLRAIASAYPDRIGKRRTRSASKGGEPSEFVLALGGSGRLAATSVVGDTDFIVAVDAEEQKRGGSEVLIRRASAVEPTWLLDLFIDHIAERDELIWNDEHQRVERLQSMSYLGLTIDEDRDPSAPRRPPHTQATATLLANAAMRTGLKRFVASDDLEGWRCRLAFAAEVSDGDIPALGEDALEEALNAACIGISSFAELRRANLLDILRAQLPAAAQASLTQWAPTHVSLPERRRVPVRYEHDRPPWIASRLQDFFGMRRGPAVAKGRVPLVLHLLAPNRRAVQVTSDLDGFWQRHYPSLRRQLMRRYPKHAWPEDPVNASPPKSGKPR